MNTRASVLLASLLFGCAPVMLSSRDQGYTFASQERCAQGPYEYKLSTVENPTGQQLVISFWQGAAPKQLLYRAEVAGSIHTGKLGTTQIAAGTNQDGSARYLDYTPTSPCVATPDPGAPGAEGAPGQPTGTTGGPPPGAAFGEPPPGQPVAVRPPVRDLLSSENPPGGHSFSLDLSQYPPKTPIRITLWTPLPYPLDDARIDISLQRLYPKDPVAYAEWQEKQTAKQNARAQRQEDADERRQPRRQARAQRRQARATARAKEQAADRAAYGPNNPSWERKERKIADSTARADAAWKVFLREDAVLTTERDTFAPPEHRKDIEDRRIQEFWKARDVLSRAYRLACDAYGHETRCAESKAGAYGESNAWLTAWRERNPAPADTPKATPPPGPPPLPWAEDQGQPPVLAASWRPGYWEWNGFHWVWLSGSWDLPPAPVIAASPTVPSPPPAAYVPPPPPKEEVMSPPPAQGYVYIRGAWRWNGKTYQWSGGAWMPLPKR